MTKERNLNAAVKSQGIDQTDRDDIAIALRPRGTRNRRRTFYTKADIAEMMGVSVRTVTRWIENQELAAHTINGVVRVSEDDFEIFLARHRGI